MVDRISHHTEFALDYEFKPKQGWGQRSPMIGASFAIKEGNEYIGYYVPIAHVESDPNGFTNFPSEEMYWKKVSPLLKSKKIIKKTWSSTENIYTKLSGIDMPIDTVHDAQMKAFLWDENELYPYRLKDCADRCLGHKRDTLKKVAGDERDVSKIPITLAGIYGTDDAIDTLMLDEWYTPDLIAEGLMDDYLSVEVPIGSIISDLVIRGIRIDGAECQRQSNLIHAKQQEIEANIYKDVGEEFNLRSTHQRGKIFFEKMGMRLRDPSGNILPLKKTKTGIYATDDEVMELLEKAGYPVARMFREHGDLEKFRSTYVDKFPMFLDPNGRYHPSFKQWGTKTGRYSSDFQQAPRPDKEKCLVCAIQGCPEPHHENGHLISVRRLVIPAPGNVLIDADYNQLELRLLAHFSQDPALLSAYQQGLDLHQATADACGCSRSDAKAINFGLAYGLTLQSLIDLLGEEKAREVFPLLRGRYKVLIRYMAAVIQAAHEDGFVRTLAGRKRRVPEINSGNWSIRSHAERQAFNALIQGSAADIVKYAQILIAKKYPELIHILQVHDEILYEAPKKYAKELAKGIKEICESVVRLRVPLLCQPKIALNWREAK